MANIYDLSDTWNDGATTFKGIGLNVTDTASASGSLLMDLQVGGASEFSVAKNGELRFSSLGFATRGVISRVSANTIGIGLTTAIRFVVDNVGAVVSSGNYFGFSPLSSLSSGPGTVDLSLFRDAADTLAQRRSTNPQAFRISNTHTDASNYERGKIAWESNVLRIGTEKAGTGSARALELQTDGVTRLAIAATGTSTFSGDVVLPAAGYLTYTGRGSIVTEADGVFRLQGATVFNRLIFGSATSSFPALKRSTTSLQVRLADDSAFTNVQGKLTTETAYTAGAPTATGYLVLYDSNGTAYKVPAEAL
jgi:hypothetical protein